MTNSTGPQPVEVSVNLGLSGKDSRVHHAEKSGRGRLTTPQCPLKNQISDEDALLPGANGS